VCSSLIHFSDWNTLKVVAQGTSMQFYINDNLMWSKTVSGLASGRLGVIAWDKGSYTRMPVSVDWATAGIPVSP
jgi:hypothetical protein